MMEVMRRCVVTATVLVAAVGAVAATDLDGFLREKGHGDVAVSVSSESYDHFWAGRSKKANPPFLGTVDIHTVSLWAAYGITDRVTLIANLPYVDAEGDGNGMVPPQATGLTGPTRFSTKESALQDMSVLAKFRLATVGSTWRSSFVGGVGFRTIASNYVANNAVSIGDGSADWLFRFVYMIQRGSFYASQQIGFDWRSGPDQVDLILRDAVTGQVLGSQTLEGSVPDGYPLYTEIGYTIGRTTIDVFYNRLVARHGTDIMGPYGTSFPSNREEYERTGAKVFVRVNPHFGVSVYGFTTLDGRNTSDASGGSVGVDFSF